MATGWVGFRYITDHFLSFGIGISNSVGLLMPKVAASFLRNWLFYLPGTFVVALPGAVKYSFPVVF